jgi:hypothetical protein
VGYVLLVVVSLLVLCEITMEFKELLQWSLNLEKKKREKRRVCVWLMVKNHPRKECERDYLYMCDHILMIGNGPNP